MPPIKSEGSLKSEMVYGFDNARKLYLDLSPKCQSTLNHDEGGMEEALKETLMSASIVLSLLNAILELFWLSVIHENVLSWMPLSHVVYVVRINA
jgi:hypothetical protein